MYTETKLSLRDPLVANIVRRTFPTYRGRKFQLRVHDAGGISLTSYWSGGSRSWFQVLRLEDFQTVTIPENGSGFTRIDAQFGPAGLPLSLPAPGFAVVEHCHFCGKDLGIRIHVHRDNAAKLLAVFSLNAHTLATEAPHA